MDLSDQRMSYDAEGIDVDALHDDPIEQFRAIGVATVRFAAANPAYFRVVNLPEVQLAITETFKDEVDLVDSLVEASAQQPEIGTDDAELIEMAGQAMVYGMARLFVDGHYAARGIGPERAEEIAEKLTGILGQGFFYSRQKVLLDKFSKRFVL